MKYLPGTRVLRSNGVEYVKTDKEGMQPVARVVAQLSGKVINGGHELQDNERVYHLDNTSIGEEEHNDPRNLVVIKFNRERFRLVKSRSRVLFLPKPTKYIREPARR